MIFSKFIESFSLQNGAESTKLFQKKSHEKLTFTQKILKAARRNITSDSRWFPSVVFLR
jgi:hypothetical protein